MNQIFALDVSVFLRFYTDPSCLHARQQRKGPSVVNLPGRKTLDQLV